MKIINLLIGNWIEVKDGDPRAVALYRRHYSCRKPEIDYCRYGFSGKGESMVLIALHCDALWCWRKVETEGIYCSVFRNESNLLSSELVKEADEMAWSHWSETRHFTHVNSKKVMSGNPGKCFKEAEWDYVRDDNGKPALTKGGLHILEIYKPELEM